MMKKKNKKKEFEEKVSQIYNRIERENIERPNSLVKAYMMASNLELKTSTVKIDVKIIDNSFYCKSSKLMYSAGDQEFQEIIMDKINDRNYAIALANIPIETTVLYYVELLDRSGIWIKRMRNDDEQQMFEFTIKDNKIAELTDWDENDLISCEVCGYMCRIEWDLCPNCNTKLHDELMKQEIFVDDQQRKEQEREKVTDPDRLAWKSVENTEIPLIECPSCNYSCQKDWKECPICNFKLDSLDHDDYSVKEEKNKEFTEYQDKDIL